MSLFDRSDSKVENSLDHRHQNDHCRFKIYFKLIDIYPISSSRRESDDLFERLSRRPSKLNYRQSFSDLLDVSACLEEDVVRSVHPAANVSERFFLCH
jgi:hypothetical protein